MAPMLVGPPAPDKRCAAPPPPPSRRPGQGVARWFATPVVSVPSVGDEPERAVAAIVAWSRRTNMIGISARAIDRPPPLVSAAEVAKRANVPLETVVDLRAAVGFP